VVGKKKVIKFYLPEGEYSDVFIKVLAMAIHLELLQPSELTYMLETGKTINSITEELGKRIKETDKYNPIIR
jgi:hypothetical protein